MSKVFLATIGTRGEVQPILALALELRSRGHRTTICAPPTFQSWAEGFGVDYVPLGPDVKKFSMRRADGKKLKISREQAQQMVRGSIVEQFRVVGDAAKDVNLIVVGGGLLCAGRSIAEARRIPYVYAAYAACTLPAPDHTPPRIRPQWFPRLVNRFLWRRHDKSWNGLFGPVLNEQRAALGLPPVDNVPRHVFTDRPWLAADAVVSPGASTDDMRIDQTGAWFLSDPTPLPEALETFLAAGEPPIYFGFGSTVSPALNAGTLIDTARRLGRRAIVSQGWANLESKEAGGDYICIDDVNHEKLFPRVAAIVHHGGAGTTTASARAGTPQFIVPHNYDQYYFAHRVKNLGIGAALKDARVLNAERLTSGLHECLNPETRSRAQSISGRIELHGAKRAADRIVQMLS